MLYVKFIILSHHYQSAKAMIPTNQPKNCRNSKNFFDLHLKTYKHIKLISI